MAFPSFTGKGSQTRFHLFLFSLWRKLENGFYVRVEDLLVLTFTKNRPYIVFLRNIPFHRSGHVMPCGNFCAEYAETKTENLFPILPAHTSSLRWCSRIKSSKVWSVYCCHKELHFTCSRVPGFVFVIGKIDSSLRLALGSC